MWTAAEYTFTCDRLVNLCSFIGFLCVCVEWRWSSAVAAVQGTAVADKMGLLFNTGSPSDRKQDPMPLLIVDRTIIS